MKKLRTTCCGWVLPCVDLHEAAALMRYPVCQGCRKLLQYDDTEAYVEEIEWPEEPKPGQIVEVPKHPWWKLWVWT